MQGPKVVRLLSMAAPLTATGAALAAAAASDVPLQTETQHGGPYQRGWDAFLETSEAARCRLRPHPEGLHGPVVSLDHSQRRPSPIPLAASGFYCPQLCFLAGGKALRMEHPFHAPIGTQYRAEVLSGCIASPFQAPVLRSAVQAQTSDKLSSSATSTAAALLPTLTTLSPAHLPWIGWNLENVQVMARLNLNGPPLGLVPHGSARALGQGIRRSGAVGGASMATDRLPQSQAGTAGLQPGAPLHQWHLRKRPEEAGQGQGGAVEQTIAKRSKQRLDREHGADKGQGTPQEHPDTAVVLLGWLGAKQRHLRRYAEWYNSQGMDAVTFVIPMGDLLSLKPTEKALVHVDNLVAEIERWLHEDEEGDARKRPQRHVVFHTFSNTGWLTYGAVLQRLQQRHGPQATAELIKGCVVDSAPVLRLDPEVFSAGFAAAMLGKRSSSTRIGSVLAGEMPAARQKKLQLSRTGEALAVERPQGSPEEGAGADEPMRSKGKEGVQERPQWPTGLFQEGLAHAVSADEVDAVIVRVGEKRKGDSGDGVPDGERSCADAQHMGAVEWTVRAFLAQFFSVVLQAPSVKRAYEEVTDVLASHQPPCPQLYIYSLADTVIPAKDVEEFMELQKAAGMSVLAKRFLNSPHVDHFRTAPQAYTKALRNFLHAIGVQQYNEK